MVMSFSVISSFEIPFQTQLKDINFKEIFLQETKHLCQVYGNQLRHVSICPAFTEEIPIAAKCECYTEEINFTPIKVGQI